VRSAFGKNTERQIFVKDVLMVTTGNTATTDVIRIVLITIATTCLESVRVAGKDGLAKCVMRNALQTVQTAKIIHPAKNARKDSSVQRVNIDVHLDARVVVEMDTDVSRVRMNMTILI